MQSIISNHTQNLFQTSLDWEKFQKQFWLASPYAHHYIDNFLGSNLFQGVVNDFQLIDGSATPTDTYNSDIELNKVCFESSPTYPHSQQVINYLSSTNFVTQLESLLGIQNIIPLTQFRTKNQSARKYLHIMRDKGFLGSHVDQSHINNGKYAHILSCIFYASKNWSPEQGGHTTLFNDDGSRPITEITFQANRLVIFLHTSNSFHGVSRLRSPTNRYSIYMDYYLPVSKLKSFVEICHHFTEKPAPKYWEHEVIFFATDKNSHYTPHYQKYLSDALKSDMSLGSFHNTIRQIKKITKSKLSSFKRNILSKTH